jgi:hypothetical protein
MNNAIPGEKMKRTLLSYTLALLSLSHLAAQQPQLSIHIKQCSIGNALRQGNSTGNHTI